MKQTTDLDTYVVILARCENFKQLSKYFLGCLVIQLSSKVDCRKQIKYESMDSTFGLFVCNRKLLNLRL